ARAARVFASPTGGVSLRSLVGKVARQVLIRQVSGGAVSVDELLDGLAQQGLAAESHAQRAALAGGSVRGARFRVGGEMPSHLDDWRRLVEVCCGEQDAYCPGGLEVSRTGE